MLTFYYDIEMQTSTETGNNIHLSLVYCCNQQNNISSRQKEIREEQKRDRFTNRAWSVVRLFFSFSFKHLYRFFLFLLNLYGPYITTFTELIPKWAYPSTLVENNKQIQSQFGA